MNCPCHSHKPYAECCAPYHQGQAAPTAVHLMRSRYSAYALGLADYIVKTAKHPPPIQEIKRFSQSTVFEDLKIVDSSEQGNRATVTFIAYLSQGGRDASYQEKSQFEKVDGRWIYTLGKTKL